MELKGFEAHYKKGEWIDLPDEVISNDIKYQTFRPWQIEAYDKLTNSINRIINAPTGSGKSILICGLSALDILKNNKLKVIISVPQNNIGNSFKEKYILLPSGSKINWAPNLNLTSSKENDKNNQIKNWLETYILAKENNVFDPSANIVICSHSVLVNLFSFLLAENQLDLLYNTSIWIDEAHHVQIAEVENKKEFTVRNKLGEIVSYCLNKNVNINFSTATLFRGDKKNIIKDIDINKFTRFNLPIDRYIGENCKYLKSLSFDFILSGTDIKNSIKEIYKTSDKTIIFQPHIASMNRYSFKDKISLLENIKDSILEVDKNNNIVDLVSDNKNRKNQIKIIDEENKNLENEKDSTIDTIITLNMFKEGSNWLIANKAIIIGQRDSIVEIIQIIGRLLRDYKDKEHVCIKMMLPFSIDQVDKDKCRDNLNEFLKTISASLLIEDIFNPIKIKAPKNTINNHANNNYINPILEISGNDEIKSFQILERLTDLTINYMSDNEQNGNYINIFRSILPEIIDNVFNEFEINKTYCGDIELIKSCVQKYIWSMWKRRTLLLSGKLLENINYDIVDDINPVGFITQYLSKTINSSSFKELRELLKSSREPHTTAEYILLASNIHKNKYNYSLVDYTNCYTKIQIICRDHGVFLQNPNAHLRGTGCPRCVGKNKPTDEFIKECIEIYGNKYDYSKSVYKTCKEKLIVICESHGEFLIAPNDHLYGKGCANCSKSKKMDTEEYIKRAIITHGYKYDYSNLTYINSKSEVDIICKEHGLFSQNASHHLSGSGCSNCAGIKKLDTEEFIKRSILKHRQEKYDYSKSIYLNITSDVIIICKDHGEFLQTPACHLNGSGCPKCVGRNKTTEDFINESKLIKDNAINYDYINAVYINNRIKVEIICNKHGSFYQVPMTHLQGSGCPVCANEKRGNRRKSK